MGFDVNGLGFPTTAAAATVNDSDVVFSDVTTNNASTSKHGYLKKLSNNSGEFMNGQGNWATPAGGSPGGSDTHVQYNNSSAFGGSANFIWDNANTQLKLTSGAAGNIPFHIKAHASQSGNLFEINSSGGSGGDITAITSGGRIILGPSNSYIAFAGGVANIGTRTATGDLLVEINTGSGKAFHVLDSSNNIVWALSPQTETISHFKGGDVASASAITPTGNLFHVTGTTTVTSITSTNVRAGTMITIIFDGALTFTDGSNLKLAGDFSTGADDTITLQYDGSNWYEICRSVN